MRPSCESKEEHFKRVAEARVNKVLSMLRLIGNLANLNAYAYTRDHVEQIYAAILAELSHTRRRLLQTGKHKKQVFRLGQPYHISEGENTMIFSFPLPDGTVLRAVGYPTDNYPAINIYWDNGVDNPDDPICFVEFNPEKEAGHEVCIGAYQNQSDETAFYEPYNKELNP